MKRFVVFTIVGGLFVLLSSFAIFASVPTEMNYQGILTNTSNDPVADSSYSVVFTIYDAPTSGISFWTETQNVTTSDGLFTVLLGSTTPIEDSVFNGTAIYLGISIEGDPEISPRSIISSVPYAFHAATADVAMTNGTDSSGWFAGGNLEDLHTGSGELTSYPHINFEYGIKFIDNMIHPALCSKWNRGLRFYNVDAYFVDSDDPSLGMRYGGVMFYIETDATDDDAATPASWRHSYWYIDYTDNTRPIRIFGSLGNSGLTVWCRKR